MEMPKYELPDDELIIRLTTPINAPGGGVVSEVTLQEPTAAQVRMAEGKLRNGVNAESFRQYQIALVTSVCKLSQAVVEQMPVSKLMEAFDYLSGFIAPRQETGKS